MRQTCSTYMTDAERLEEIYELLSELDELSKDHVLLIEGKKDRRALTALGVSGDMFQIQSDGGPVKAAEYVEEHGGKCVVLTDWDDRGDMLADRLCEMLDDHAVVDTHIRRGLRRLCSSYIKDMESLDSLVGRLRT